MKRGLFIFIAAIIFIIVSILYINSNNCSMTDELSKVVKSYGSNRSSVRLLRRDELNWLSNSSQIGFKLAESMTNSDKIVDISFIPKSRNYIKQPNEIYAIFKCWLKLHESERTDIKAIMCSYSTGGHFDYDTYLIIISQNIFLDLYNKLDLTGKNQEEIVDELGAIWMRQNMYNRQGLIFDKQDEHIRLYVTPWNTSQVSPDEKFVLSCDYSNCEIKVQKVTKHEDISLLYDIWSTKVDEQEYLYGAWDKNNNILIYNGEMTVRKFKYNGADSWVSE